MTHYSFPSLTKAGELQWRVPPLHSHLNPVKNLLVFCSFFFLPIFPTTSHHFYHSVVG
uniref:Uncharacterized protein n=1 Tax=Nelumbo nucifera TaxID=4432 RepID=A0A822YQU3_NELNU|nr:TPA_asm: hypothetical protein HUJ06_012590 [Nelumbo nucifera]